MIISKIQKETILYSQILELSNFHNIKGDVGAISSFIGVVRADKKDDKNVVKAIEYECYEEIAIQEITQILEEAQKLFDIKDIICIHRSGLVKVNEIAVWIEVIATHRKDAMKSCEYIIENLKKRVPIWKKEIYEDGAYKWI